ncbi:MAG TPA: non-homologous end-joining DNA ligase [Planctomycetaceae bacterium]|jgi:bifunctional non-homologous end joining protein LigD|nr:non-homologous end-joining DNA ligase [Planctomycetaceae bacterium]
MAVKRRTTAKKTPAKKTKSSVDLLQGVRLTHPDRVVYPDVGITKRDVAEYFVAVAPWMLPHVAGRPLSLVRCPAGMAGTCFYQKQPPQGLPPSVQLIKIQIKDTLTVNTYIEDVDGLLALVQFGVLEIHAWQSQADDIERPDRLVFDLDPGPDVEWTRVIDAALLVRDFLKHLGLTSFVKTTGGKGLHVVAPIARNRSWDEVKDFCHGIATVITGADPNHFAATMSKAARPGKIYIDYLRNERGSTAIAPYSTRARDGAPVSMPLTWTELRDVKSGAAFTVANATAYLKKRKRDPWESYGRLKQRITEAAVKSIAKLRSPR